MSLLTNLQTDPSIYLLQDSQLNELIYKKS